VGETGRVACFMGPRKPFELREYPLPDPEPGAILLQVTRANVCGSDLHFWGGDFDLEAFGLPVPTVLGHEVTGRVARLGPGVDTDATGAPLREGDRVVFKYFYPCGRCRDCLRGNAAACLASQGSIMQDPDFEPHFTGGFGDYLYLMPGHTVLKAPDGVPDEVLAGLNCGLAEVLFGLQRARLDLGDAVVVQGCGGLGRVQDLTGGWGADVAVEVVGHPAVVDEGLRMLAAGGRYIEIGNISPGRTCTLDPSLLTVFSRSLIGVVLYSTDALMRGLDFLARAHERYPFEAMNSVTFPLARIDEAFAAAEGHDVIRASLVP
jgi:D-arabinose 1-dehydrogenase-like Zn-dependent alcohol dehydrogenase